MLERNAWLAGNSAAGKSKGAERIRCSGKPLVRVPMADSVWGHVKSR